jgi:hypothetical protein
MDNQVEEPTPEAPPPMAEDEDKEDVPEDEVLSAASTTEGTELATGGGNGESLLKIRLIVKYINYMPCRLLSVFT